MAKLLDEMRRGITPSLLPYREIARADALQALWSQSGLEAIEQRAIIVERTFASFDQFWASSASSGSVVASLGPRPLSELDDFKTRVRMPLPAPDLGGRLTMSARANAIISRKPARE